MLEWTFLVIRSFEHCPFMLTLQYDLPSPNLSLHFHSQFHKIDTFKNPQPHVFSSP